MSNCIACKTGAMTQSGTWSFCTNCGFSHFVVNSDYVNACTTLLGALVSNVKYASDLAYREAITEHVSRHLPMMVQSMAGMTQESFDLIIKSLSEGAKQQSINLQIGDAEPINKETPELMCCGKHDFVMNDSSPFRLNCTHCGALWVQDGDIYQPYFLCECGSHLYEEHEGVAYCLVCTKRYVHNKVDDILMPIGR